VVIYCRIHEAFGIHSHQSAGLEHIPLNQATMFVTYYGSFPADYPAINANISRYEETKVFTAVSNKQYLPCHDLMEFLDVGMWDNEECINILKEGHDLIISPAVHKQMHFADSMYNLYWGDDMDFAKIAKESKVPIIPVFTMNLQEAFSMPCFLEPFLRGRYARKNTLVTIVAGAYPVKLITIFGKPIAYDENMTEEDIFHKTKEALQKLIQENQRIPGSKWQAFCDRFRKINVKTEFEERSATEELPTVSLDSSEIV